MQSFGSLLLSWRFNVTNWKMSDNFPHILMFEQGFETGLVCEKKKPKLHQNPIEVE